MSKEIAATNEMQQACTTLPHPPQLLRAPQIRGGGTAVKLHDVGRVRRSARLNPVVVDGELQEGEGRVQPGCLQGGPAGSLHKYHTMSGTVESLKAGHVSALASMGFPERDAVEALRRTNNDINHAVELLSSGNGASASIYNGPMGKGDNNSNSSHV